MNDFEKEKDIEYAMSVLQKKIDEAYILGVHSRDEEITRLLAEIDRLSDIIYQLETTLDTAEREIGYRDEILKDISDSAGYSWQLDDERIPYVPVQIDKSTLSDIQALPRQGRE